MAYISLKSDNPNFSHVMQKNPATQEAAGVPFEKQTANARAYFWYNSPNDALLILRNFENKKVKGFSYLDYSQYSSGQSLLQLISLHLRSVMSKPHELDNESATLKFTVYNRLQKDFKLTFPGKVIECNNQSLHSTIVIKGDTIKEAVEICSLISLFSFLHDPDVFVEAPQFTRLLNIAVDKTTHYPFLRNFVSFIKSPHMFADLKSILDKTPFNFNLKRSYDVRKDYYLEHAVKTGNKKLVDLGCGEGGYFKLHLKNYDTIDAVEVDPDTFIDATHSARKIQAEDKITVHHSSIEDYLDSLTTLKGTDVLITEVLEHMPHSNALEIVERLVKLEPEQIILTLPNHSFNKFYDLAEGEFRHDDHDWEPDYAMIKYLLDTIWPLEGYDYTVEFLGDSLKTDSTVCSSFGINFIRSEGEPV